MGDVFLFLIRGDRNKCIYAKHQRTCETLVKQMRERIPEKEEKKAVWKSPEQKKKNST